MWNFYAFSSKETSVTHGWLKPMLMFCTEIRIAFFGNKHFFPGTVKLHHYGIAFDVNGLPCFSLFRGWKIIPAT